MVHLQPARHLTDTDGEGREGSDATVNFEFEAKQRKGAKMRQVVQCANAQWMHGAIASYFTA